MAPTSASGSLSRHAAGAASSTSRPRRSSRARGRLGRTEPAFDVDVVRTEGAFVHDSDGRTYVDFLSSWCVGDLGWGDERSLDVLASYRGPDYVEPYLRYAGWDDLAEALVEVAPAGLTTCWRATGGTEAVDLAMSAAILHTKRQGFVSIEGCYHGDSLATSALATDAFEIASRKGLFVERIDLPLDGRAAAKVERILARRKTAAVVMEPVVISAAVEVPSPEFVRRVAAACGEHGTLFVADEVATGFGRTGTLFACERYGLRPDALCLAKAVTGGYEPMAALLTTTALARSMKDHETYYSTYGWHPRAVAIALDRLQRLRREWPSRERHVTEASRWFRRRLAALFGDDARIGGAGLAITVRLPNEDAESLVKRALEEGVIVDSHDDDLLVLFPPLSIDRESAEEGIRRLARSVR